MKQTQLAYKTLLNGVSDDGYKCSKQILTTWRPSGVRQSLSYHQRMDLKHGIGLGQAWLNRVQNTLARIHRQEGSSSSSSASSARQGSISDRLSYTPSEEAREAERQRQEADNRAHTEDYVEARGMLLPATEYLSRAVAIARDSVGTTGDLLALAAEAYMSLGNVSYSHLSERYFQQAIVYLRQASELEGYRLSPYLQT